MNQNRKDQDVRERNRSSEASRDSHSVMDDQESFEHGSGTSEVARGMGSSSERGMESGRSSGKGGSQSKSGISNRGIDEERDEQSRVPERGRSRSEE